MRSYHKPHSWNAVCSNCNQEKNSSEFYLHSNGKPRKQCKECRNDANTAWKSTHPVEVKKIEQRQRELHYEAKLEATRKWRKSNPKYNAFRSRTYDARKRNQIPSWADLNKIKQIYFNCPEGYEVDHIIPLKGALVSGLHVETNLQYLTPRENRQKRNLYEIVL